MITEYRYNAERDRIDRYAWHPSFFTVQYDGIEGKRKEVYWACTNSPGHLATIAEKGKAYEDEQVVKISTMLRDNYTKWLLNGASELTVNGKTIPGEFVVRFLIAEACDFSRNSEYSTQTQRNREGDLSSYRDAFAGGNAALKEKILKSFEACQPENDKIRSFEVSKEYSTDNSYTHKMLLDAQNADSIETDQDMEQEM